MPKIAKVAHETKEGNHPKQDLPRYRVSKQGDFNRDCKAGQPEEKFKKSQSYNTAMCVTFDHAGFSNAETLQLLTTRTFLQMDFYCSLQGR